MLVVKNLHANAGDIREAGSIPGSGRSLGVGNGNPFQYSCQGNPMDWGALWATVHGVASSCASTVQLRMCARARAHARVHTHTHTQTQKISMQAKSTPYGHGYLSKKAESCFIYVTLYFKTKEIYSLLLTTVTCRKLLEDIHLKMVTLL